MADRMRVLVTHDLVEGSLELLHRHYEVVEIHGAGTRVVTDRAI